MTFEWHPKTFGDLVDFVSSKDSSTKVDPERYVSTESMLPNFGGIQKAATVPLNSGVTKFSIDDILFSNIRTYFKKVWRAQFNGHCSNDVLVFRPKDSGVLLPGYLHHLCRWERFTEFSVRTSKGAKMPRGDKDALAQFSFESPPIEIQRAIVEILDSLDDRITLLRETSQTLEAMAQAIFKSWFVDFDPVRAKSQGLEPEGMDADTAALFPDAFEEIELGVVPRGWTFQAVGDLLVPKRGKSITKTKCVDGGIPVVAGGLEPAYFHNQSNVHSPVVTISASGANAGFVRLYQKDIWASDCSFVSAEQTEAIYFWYAFLKFNQKKIYFMQQGAAQPHIYPSDLIRLIVCSPKSDKLRNIFNSLVSPLFDRIGLNDAKIQTLSNLRDTLLPCLISGQLQMPDAEQAIEKATA